MATYSKTQWFYETDHETRGPVSTEELKERICSGKLRPHHQIKSDRRTGGKWVAMERFPQLKHLFLAAQRARHEERAKRAVEKRSAPRAVPAPPPAPPKAPLTRPAASELITEPAQAIATPHPPEHASPAPQSTPAFQPAPNHVVNVHVGHSSRDSNTAAVLLNAFLWPGLGHFAQGRPLAGFFWGTAFLVSLVSIFFLIGVFLAPLTYILALTDAASYRG